MTTLLLARHGETFDNENQIMQGQTQGSLNARGIVETCSIVADRCGMTVVTTPLLRERDWGGFTGRFIPSIKGEPFPEDVEPLDSMFDRAQRFLDFVSEQYQGKTVLAVGHGIINKAIQAQYHHTQMKEIERMNNAEVRTLILP